MPSVQEVQAMEAMPRVAKGLERLATVAEAFVGGMERAESDVGEALKQASELSRIANWALEDLAYTAPEDAGRQRRAFTLLREAIDRFNDAEAKLHG